MTHQHPFQFVHPDPDTRPHAVLIGTCFGGLAGAVRLGARGYRVTVLEQLAWFRPHNESEEIDTLFIVGAGTHPGAGMPGVLSAAKILDKVIPDALHFAR